MSDAPAFALREMIAFIEANPEHAYWFAFEKERRSVFAVPEEGARLVQDALRHRAPKVRRYMARLILDLARERAVTALTPLLSDPDDKVRIEACGGVFGESAWAHTRAAEGKRAPAVSGAERATLERALLELVASSIPYVRSDALRLLVELGGASVAHQLSNRVHAGSLDVLHALAAIPEGAATVVALTRSPDCAVRAEEARAMIRAASSC